MLEKLYDYFERNPMIGYFALVVATATVILVLTFLGL